MIKGSDILLIGGIALGVYYLNRLKDENKPEDNTSDDNNNLSLELDTENDETGIMSYLDEQGKDLSNWVFENENGEISYNDEAFDELANSMVPFPFDNPDMQLWPQYLQCCNEEDNTTYDERVNMVQQFLVDKEYVNDTPEILAYLMDYIDMYCQERQPCDNEITGEDGRKADNISFVDGEDDSLLYGEDEFINLNSNDVFAPAEKKIRKFS